MVLLLIKMKKQPIKLQMSPQIEKKMNLYCLLPQVEIMECISKKN